MYLLFTSLLNSVAKYYFIAFLYVLTFKLLYRSLIINVFSFDAGGKIDESLRDLF